MMYTGQDQARHVTDAPPKLVPRFPSIVADIELAIEHSFREADTIAMAFHRIGAPRPEPISKDDNQANPGIPDTVEQQLNYFAGKLQKLAGRLESIGQDFNSIV